PLEECDRLLRERDVGRVGELVPDAAGVAPGGPGAELRLALEQHHVGDTPRGQVVRDAGPHAAAADDHHIRCCLHPSAVLAIYRSMHTMPRLFLLVALAVAVAGPQAPAASQSRAAVAIAA